MQLTYCPECSATAIEPWRHRGDAREVWSCRRCGLRFLRDRFDDVEELYGPDYFDQKVPEGQRVPAVGYPAYSETMPVDFRWQEALLHLLAGEPGSLLDVGCALGRFLAIARRAGWACRGVELSQSAAEHCRALGFEVDPRLDEVAVRPFEIITAWELLEHLPALRPALIAIRDLLGDDGLFLFSTPDAGAAAVVARGDDWIGLNSSLEHLTYLTSDYLEPVLREIFGSEPRFLSVGAGEYATLIGIVRKGGLRPDDLLRHQQLAERQLTPSLTLAAESAREIGWFWFCLTLADPNVAQETLDALRASGHDVALAEGMLLLHRQDLEGAATRLRSAAEGSDWSGEALQWLWRCELQRRWMALREVDRLIAVEAEVRSSLDSERRAGEARHVADRATAAEELAGLKETHARQLASLQQRIEAAADSMRVAVEEKRLLQVSAAYRIGRPLTRVLERLPHAQAGWGVVEELLRGGPRPFVRERVRQLRARGGGLVARLRETSAPSGPSAPPPSARSVRHVPVQSDLVPDLISVILPVYNQASLLAQSIDSVLCQTYPRIELIVLDDGSRDDVNRVLDRYRTDPRVRLLTQRNLGLPKALSNAFMFAEGELWTWTSADNIMEPTQLERMIPFLRSRPDVDMTFADYLAIDDRGDLLRDPSFRPQNRRTPNDPEIHLPSDVSKLNTVQDNFIGPCFLYRGHAGIAIGEYDPAMGVEDYDYWMRMNDLFLLWHLGTDEVLYRYRVHDNSLNARAVEHRIYDHAAALMAHEAERKRYYTTRFSLEPDARSRAVIPTLGVEHRAELADLHSERDKRVRVIAGDAAVSDLELPTVLWFGPESAAPYRWATALSRSQVVAVGTDEAVLARIGVAGGRGFAHRELGHAFESALAALDSSSFYERTKPEAARRRPPPDVYGARSSAPVIALEVQSFDKGGLEQVVVDLAVTLRQGGARPLIVVLGELGLAARHAEALGLPVVQVPEIGREQAYADLLSRQEVSLVNAHYSLFGAPIAARLGIPFVQTIHNSYVWLSAAQRLAYVEADQHTTGYVCVSMSAAQFSDVSMKLPASRMVVIENGVDSARFRPTSADERARLRRKHAIADDAFVYLNVASTQQGKGQRQVVAAFERVRSRVPQARLILAGGAADPGFWGELQNVIAQKGLQSAITTPGHLLEIEELYALADAFVLPSFYEGWSLALAEALLSGLPCIATDCGAAREVLARTGGELIPLPFASLAEFDLARLGPIFQSPEPLASQLAEAMLRVERDRPRPRVSDETRRRFDRTQAFARHRDLFDWLIAGGSVRSARRWLRARTEHAVAQPAVSAEIDPLVPKTLARE